MEMTRELFTRMLESREELSRDGDRYSVDGEAHFDVLIVAASGGPVPVARVRSVKLGDDFVLLHAKEAEYTLPYEMLVGLKFTVREQEPGARRTGFLP